MVGGVSFFLAKNADGWSSRSGCVESVQFLNRGINICTLPATPPAVAGGERGAASLDTLFIYPNAFFIQMTCVLVLNASGVEKKINKNPMRPVY